MYKFYLFCFLFSHYKWQIPVYTDGFTILVDITKVTSIPDDIPKDAKETLKDKLNKWTVGAVWVYDAETVDYDNTVTTSLEEAGYNSDEYSYEVVSGLPGIRGKVLEISSRFSALSSFFANVL